MRRYRVLKHKEVQKFIIVTHSGKVLRKGPDVYAWVYEHFGDVITALVQNDIQPCVEYKSQAFKQFTEEILIPPFDQLEEIYPEYLL